MKEKYYKVSKTITKWKYDTPFENWLGYKADNSEFWKSVYLLYYRIHNPKYYESGISIANKLIEKYLPYTNIRISSLKQKNALIKDMIYSLHRFGICYDEYFIYNIYNKNTIGRESFDNLKIHYGYCDLVNGDDVRAIFEDKGRCYDVFRDFFKRDLLIVKSEDDRIKFEAFINKHHSFIVKPQKGHSGIGIQIIHEMPASKYNDFFDSKLGNGPFVIEEIIEQGKEMEMLHPQSINTLRIITFKINKKVTIIGAAVRIGVGGSYVDNAGAGGIYASIDTEYGIVNSDARNNLGQRFTIHPNTNVTIPGYVIPNWREALELVTKTARIIDSATMIAWDLAYGKNGWLMIEGNDVGEPYLFQAPYQLGKKQDIISLIDEYIKEKNYQS